MIEHEGKVLFTENELRCKGSGLLRLAPGFADKLRDLRVDMDHPMIVNSACRSKAHNESIDGHPRSLHVGDEPHWPTGGCCAIDIRTHRWNGKEWIPINSWYRDVLIEVAWDLGWSIGYGASFLHLDRRIDYTALKQAEFNY